MWQLRFYRTTFEFTPEIYLENWSSKDESRPKASTLTIYFSHIELVENFRIENVCHKCLSLNIGGWLLLVTYVIGGVAGKRPKDSPKRVTQH